MTLECDFGALEEAASALQGCDGGFGFEALEPADPLRPERGDQRIDLLIRQRRDHGPSAPMRSVISQRCWRRASSGLRRLAGVPQRNCMENYTDQLAP
jgi:hypothetical protein